MFDLEVVSCQGGLKCVLLFVAQIKSLNVLNPLLFSLVITYAWFLLTCLLAEFASDFGWLDSQWVFCCKLLFLFYFHLNSWALCLQGYVFFVQAHSYYWLSPFYIVDCFSGLFSHFDCYLHLFFCFIWHCWSYPTIIDIELLFW